MELCLTVPVRLSALLPHLHYLMRPLVLALQAGPDLVSQGLRTLELCIDNLTPAFLDPIMAPVIGDLMQALWKVMHHRAPRLPRARTDRGRSRRARALFCGLGDCVGRRSTCVRLRTARTTASRPCAFSASLAGEIGGC